MNLTNFHKTPIHRVVEMVRREAQRYGVGIHHSELVGLLPQAALVDTAVWYTQLDQFDPQQILESRLYAAQQDVAAGQSSRYEFIDDLASSNPTPGGGSAAAFTAAEAAALVAMVGRVTLGKKSYAAVEPQMREMIEKAETLRAELTAAVEEDSAAFEGFMQALRLPKSTEEEIARRATAMEEATLAAAVVPHRVAGQAMEALRLSQLAVELGNLNAVSDAASASYLAVAAVKGAGMNVMINRNALRAPAAADHLLADIQAYQAEITAIEERIALTLRERVNF